MDVFCPTFLISAKNGLLMRFFGGEGKISRRLKRTLYSVPGASQSLFVVCSKSSQYPSRLAHSPSMSASFAANSLSNQLPCKFSPFFCAEGVHLTFVMCYFKILKSFFYHFRKYGKLKIFIPISCCTTTI
jgi:hypothetical protein